MITIKIHHCSCSRSQQAAAASSVIITIIIFRSINRESLKMKRNSALNPLCYKYINNAALYTKRTEKSSVNTEFTTYLSNTEKYADTFWIAQSLIPSLFFVFTRTFQFAQLIKMFPKIYGRQDILIRKLKYINIFPSRFKFSFKWHKRSWRSRRRFRFQKRACTLRFL